MNGVEKVLIVLGVLGMLTIMGHQAYLAGSHAGYAQGWSDAQCGPGRDCEAGQF